MTVWVFFVKGRHLCHKRRSNSSVDVAGACVLTVLNRTILMSDLIDKTDLKDYLKKVPEWDHEKKHIERLFEFDDFTESIDFVNAIAEIVEEDEHHPDIDIRWNKVKVMCTTHSKNGLTELDFELAEKIDNLVG